MKNLNAEKYWITAITAVLLCLFFQTAAHALSYGGIEKYELYNNGELTDISTVCADGELYIDVNDIHKLGLIVYDTENGICISNGEDNINILFDGSPAIFKQQVFENPLIDTARRKLVLMNIIGKCYSEVNRGERYNGNIWRSYLAVESVNDGYKQKTAILEDVTLDFEHDIGVVRYENKSRYGFSGAKAVMAYYTNGKLVKTESVNKYEIEPGEKITAVFSVKEEFEKSDVQIMFWDENGRPISDVTVLKECEYKPCTVPPLGDEERIPIFSDITADSKYYDAVYVLNKRFRDIGMFNGYEDGSYKPLNTMLKSEFAYVFCGLIGVNLDNLCVNYDFADVPSDMWCKNAVAYMVSNGYMEPVEGQFFPNDSLRFDEAAKAFLAVLGEKDLKSSEIIKTAEKYGLLDTMDTCSILITRGEFAQLAYNFMEKYIKL